MPYSLHDRNVLISGGSRYGLPPTTPFHANQKNSGLGALVAQKFASEGCNLAINYVSSKEAAEKLAADLQSQYKVKVITVQGVWILPPWLRNYC